MVRVCINLRGQRTCAIHGSGVNRGHVTLFREYVDNVYDCRVSVGASERFHRRWGGCRFRFDFNARR